MQSVARARYQEGSCGRLPFRRASQLQVQPVHEAVEQG